MAGEDSLLVNSGRDLETRNSTMTRAVCTVFKGAHLPRRDLTEMRRACECVCVCDACWGGRDVVLAEARPINPNI
jgi:hypothetical protein